jgi:hypothetical protein
MRAGPKSRLGDSRVGADKPVRARRSGVATLREPASGRIDGWSCLSTMSRPRFGPYNRREGLARIAHGRIGSVH